MKIPPLMVPLFASLSHDEKCQLYTVDAKWLVDSYFLLHEMTSNDGTRDGLGG